MDRQKREGVARAQGRGRNQMSLSHFVWQWMWLSSSHSLSLSLLLIISISLRDKGPMGGFYLQYFCTAMRPHNTNRLHLNKELRCLYMCSCISWIRGVVFRWVPVTQSPVSLQTGEIQSTEKHDPPGCVKDGGRVGARLPPLRPSYHLLGDHQRSQRCPFSWMLCWVLLHLVFPAQCLNFRVLHTICVGGLLQPEHLPEHPSQE